MRFDAATSPDAYVVPNLRGGRIARQRVGEVLAEAGAEASETLRKRGLPRLPRVTPHSLRRTYISIALLANNFDIKWVMGQVGHADSKMTLDVYAQLEQRAKRDHGTSFDRLSRQARDLHGAVRGPSDATELALKRPQPGNQPDRESVEPDSSFYEKSG
jgi:integrase